MDIFLPLKKLDSNLQLKQIFAYFNVDIKACFGRFVLENWFFCLQTLKEDCLEIIPCLIMLYNKMVIKRDFFHWPLFNFLIL